MQDLCVLDECIAVDVALFYKLIFCLLHHLTWFELVAQCCLSLQQTIACLL